MKRRFNTAGPCIEGVHDMIPPWGSSGWIRGGLVIFDQRSDAGEVAARPWFEVTPSGRPVTVVWA